MFRNFKSFASSIEGIYLVETSATLREIQKQLLCGDDAAMEETDIGHKSVSKYFDVPIVWVEDIRLLPNGRNISSLSATNERPKLMHTQKRTKRRLYSPTNSSTHSPSTPSNPSPRHPKTKHKKS